MNNLTKHTHLANSNTSLFNFPSEVPAAPECVVLEEGRQLLQGIHSTLPTKENESK